MGTKLLASDRVLKGNFSLRFLPFLNWLIAEFYFVQYKYETVKFLLNQILEFLKLN